MHLGEACAAAQPRRLPAAHTPISAQQPYDASVSRIQYTIHYSGCEKQKEEARHELLCNCPGPAKMNSETTRCLAPQGQTESQCPYWGQAVQIGTRHFACAMMRNSRGEIRHSEWLTNREAGNGRVAPARTPEDGRETKRWRSCRTQPHVHETPQKGPSSIKSAVAAEGPPTNLERVFGG